MDRNLNALGIALNQKSEIKLQQISCCVNLIQQSQTDTGVVILPTYAPQKAGDILPYGWIYILGGL